MAGLGLIGETLAVSCTQYSGMEPRICINSGQKAAVNFLHVAHIYQKTGKYLDQESHSQHLLGSEHLYVADLVLRMPIFTDNYNRILALALIKQR